MQLLVHHEAVGWYINREHGSIVELNADFNNEYWTLDLTELFVFLSYLIWVHISKFCACLN